MDRLPKYLGSAVVAYCRDCEAPTTFEPRYEGMGGSAAFTIRTKQHYYNRTSFKRTLYQLLRCAVCGAGGLAIVHDNGNSAGAVIECFLPSVAVLAKLPPGTPDDIVNELREAEVCLAANAFRGAAALLRSALEKTFHRNGYTDGKLFQKIEKAADDGLITEARKKRAHDEIRLLGNDVLHETWRAVDQDEVFQAHHYTQRVIEDFYDDRASVEAQLKFIGRSFQ